MLFISGIIFILGLWITKHLDNKALYLERLKIELNKINKEARPLEDMEKRIRMLDAQPLKKPSLLDIIYELHQVAPQQISLISFSCEEDNQIILHGQTSELNSVFVFTSQLEKSTAFKNFNIKVRYATKKGTPSGEMVDFEILCIRK